MLHSLGETNSKSGGIVVMFDDSGFWFKVQVEKLQGILAKVIIKESHCYNILVY
jgi:hypothetical protein